MLNLLAKAKVRRSTTETGFTLLELLIVLIVIGILAAIAVPILINQQRAAIEATVKSDVRNTVAQVQQWRSEGANSLLPVANTKVYTTLGGTITKSRDGSVIGITGRTDGSYTVCEFDSAASKSNAAETSWSYDSATGHFTQQGGTSGQCAGAVNGDGNDVSTTPVAPAFSTAALATGTQETDYTGSVKATGNPAPTYSAPTTGVNALIAGLSLNSTTGVITGEPTAPAGDYEVTVTARNFAGSITKKFAIRVLSKDAAPYWTQGTSASALTATRGTQYAGYDAGANGYPAPKYTIASGSLPSGLQLNADTGALTGTPDNGAVTSTAVIKATNRAGAATLSLTIPVQYAAGFATATLPAGFVDTPYNQQIEVTGNPTPTTTVTSSSLPTGVTAKVNATTGNVALSGTPKVAGTWSITVRTVNSVGSAANQTFTFTMASSTVFSENFEGYTPTYYNTTMPTGWSKVGSYYCGVTGVTDKNTIFAGYGDTRYLLIGSCYTEGTVSANSPSFTLTPGTYTVSAMVAGQSSQVSKGRQLTLLNASTNANLGSAAGGSSQYVASPLTFNVTVTSTTNVKLLFETMHSGYTGGSGQGLVIDNVLVKRVS